MAYPRFSARFLTSVVSLSGLTLALSAACGGSSFDAGGSAGDAGANAGGTDASGGAGAGTSTAGTSAGGASAGSGTGGSHKGGTSGKGGTGAGGTTSMGGASTGGTTSSGGTTSMGGASTGGTTSTGGTSSGGAGASGTTGGGPDCAAMKTDYAATVQKARGCDMGSTDECSPSSTMPVFGCGCPTLVNAKSTYTELAKKKYQAIQDAKCPSGPVCGIACIAITSASCSMQTTSSGSAYQCVGMSGIATN